MGSQYYIQLVTHSDFNTKNPTYIEKELESRIGKYADKVNFYEILSKERVSEIHEFMMYLGDKRGNLTGDFIIPMETLSGKNRLRIQTRPIFILAEQKGIDFAKKRVLRAYQEKITLQRFEDPTLISELSLKRMYDCPGTQPFRGYLDLAEPMAVFTDNIAYRNFAQLLDYNAATILDEAKTKATEKRKARFQQRTLILNSNKKARTEIEDKIGQIVSDEEAPTKEDIQNIEVNSPYSLFRKATRKQAAQTYL